MSNQDYNLKKSANNLYVARTQAGFKKLIKIFTQDDLTWYNKYYAFADECSYPKKYPSVVIISFGYCGFHYFETKVTPISEYIGNQIDLLEQLHRE